MRALSLGDQGQDVREFQEMLCLRGYSTQIDGVFGPATRAAFEAFCDAINGSYRPSPAKKKPVCEYQVSCDEVRISRSLPVQPLAMSELRRPFSEALRASRCALKVSSVGIHSELAASQIYRYAEQHLRAGAREVGGNNCGPWVRTYTLGREGPDAPWCAAFVSHCMMQATRSIRYKPSIPHTLSCDVLLKHAQQRNAIVAADAVAKEWDESIIGVFFVMRNSWDAVHTGFFRRVSDRAFMTIEGNTNAAGNRDGQAVASHFRAFRGAYRYQFASLSALLEPVLASTHEVSSTEPDVDDNDDDSVCDDDEPREHATSRGHRAVSTADSPERETGNRRGRSRKAGSESEAQGE